MFRCDIYLNQPWKIENSKMHDYEGVARFVSTSEIKKKNHVLGIAQPFLNSIHLRVFILIFQSFARKENLSDRFKQVQVLLSRVTKCS